MKLDFGRCPECKYIIELDNNNEIFICPYCEKKITKKSSKDILASELNNKIIINKIEETITKAQKELDSNNYANADKLYHEIIAINPYNTQSYIGLIVAKTHNFTKKPVIVKGNLETINIKEIEKIIDILTRLNSDNKYTDFINKTILYIKNYKKMVEDIEDSTLYIQLKMINSGSNKSSKINKKYLKKVLYVISVIISIILFIIEPLYGFIFLISSSVIIGLLKS